VEYNIEGRTTVGEETSGKAGLEGTISTIFQL
jgi:hypothetical protein